MEKLIKEKFKESTEKLTKGQTKEIKEMVKKSSAVGGERLAKLAERVEMNIGLNEE
jgi:predicted lactoylglutathione lyase